MRARSARSDDASRSASARTGTARSSVLELGQEEECLGAERAGFGLGTADPSRSFVRASTPRQRGAHAQRPALACGGRQPDPAASAGAPALPARRSTADAPRSCRQRGSVIEQARNVGVRHVGRERDVAGGEDRVVDDLGDPGVNAPSLFAQVGVQNRRQQRVGEADHPVLALDHARGDRGVQRVRRQRPRAPGATPTSCRRRPQRQARCEWTQGAPRSARSRALRAVSGTASG